MGLLSCTGVPRLLPFLFLLPHVYISLVAADSRPAAKQSTDLSTAAVHTYTGPGLLKPRATSRSFTIADHGDMFLKDQAPFRLISGSIHYHRIPPAYWVDRLARVKAMGCNAIQMYVPWNWHQPTPEPLGPHSWSGWRNITRFIQMAGDMGLLVLLRPGPYVCAEWDAGGLPAWLQQPIPAPGGGTTYMKLRTSDPAYLAAVDAWFGALLPLMAPLTYDKGGPIIMVQIENEYGSYGADKVYLRHLSGLVRWHMGDQVLQYTTDNAGLGPVTAGSLPEVYTVVDFGPGVLPSLAFPLQKAFNPPGQSPYFCSEYYTGWLTHWGETMANTSAAAVAETLGAILAYNSNKGSVNFYMAHGGTNFGVWAGANLFNSEDASQVSQRAEEAGEWHRGRLYQPRHQTLQVEGQLEPLVPHAQPQASTAEGAAAAGAGAMQLARRLLHGMGRLLEVSSSAPAPAAVPLSRGPFLPEIYMGHITSYDYCSPIGEAGTYGQIGIGGESKFEAIRATVAAAEGCTLAQLPAAPAQPNLWAYGVVQLQQQARVLNQLAALTPSCRGSPFFDQSKLPAGVEGSGDADEAAHVISRSTYPQPMERYGQYYGQIVYETTIPGALLQAGGDLVLPNAHDMAYVYLGGSKYLGRSYRGGPTLYQLQPQPGAGDAVLQLVAESMGRTNFAFGVNGLLDPKGLTGNVTLAGQVLTGWTMYHLCLAGNFTTQTQWEAISAPHAGAQASTSAGAQQQAHRAHWLSPARRSKAATQFLGLSQAVSQAARQLLHAAASTPSSSRAASMHAAEPAQAQPGVQLAIRPPTFCPPGGGPVFYRGWLTVNRTSVRAGDGQDHPPDSFIHMMGWSKGQVWVNGRALGRYWQSQGPQQTLYVPGLWLRWSDQEQEVTSSTTPSTTTSSSSNSMMQKQEQEQSSMEAAGWLHSQQLSLDWSGEVAPGGGANEVLVLELGGCRSQHWKPAVVFTAVPDFAGPPGGPAPY